MTLIDNTLSITHISSMINRMSRGLHGETSCLGKGSVCSRGLLTSVSLIVDLITPTPRLGFRNKHESLETKKKRTVSLYNTDCSYEVC